jgi:hypothetical protein
MARCIVHYQTGHLVQATDDELQFFPGPIGVALVETSSPVRAYISAVSQWAISDKDVQIFDLEEDLGNQAGFTDSEIALIRRSIPQRQDDLVPGRARQITKIEVSPES